MTEPFVATPPHSLIAEKTTLGALLLDGDAMLDVAPVLKPEDFYDPVHAAIYSAMQRLYESRSPIDFTTVAAAINDNPKIQAIGGSAFLAGLAHDVPTSSHIKKYADIVREKSLRRQLERHGKRLAALAQDNDRTAGELLETAEQEILRLSRQSAQQTSFDLADLREERFSHYAEVYEAEEKAAFYGLTTGFSDLDRLLTGLPPGDLIVLAARPSMGKTAFALDIAQHVVNSLDKIVMLISLEMSKEQVADRILAGALGVSTHDLKKGMIEEEHFKEMGTVFDGIRKDRLFIDDDPDSTLANLRSKARRQQMENGLDLLIVDYLQLIDVGRRVAPENRVQEVSKISRDLKRLARELRVPVIAVSQLSRNVENRAGQTPTTF
jgi:replicative DNA helicase